jgi:hypothetical protein
MNIFKSWWKARQRRIDIQVLWPACKTQAVDLDHAKAAFAYHAFNDSAWTDVFTHEEIKDIIGSMS